MDSKQKVTPIDHISYPATHSFATPEEFQTWLDEHGHTTSTVATEKLDGATTVFWVRRGRCTEEDAGSYAQVALFNRNHVLYVAHVYDDVTQWHTTSFQAERNEYPDHTGAMLSITKRDRFLQPLVAVHRSFTAARPDCDEIMICGETMYLYISSKIAYANPEPRFVSFGLQFKMHYDDQGSWFWSDWHEGRKHITRAGLEHVRQLEVAPRARASVANLRHFVEHLISDYVDQSSGGPPGEKRVAGVIFRTRYEVRVDEAQLIKFNRSSYEFLPTLAAAVGKEKATLQDYFEFVPLKEWINHATNCNGHWMWCDGRIEDEHKAIALDIHEEVLKRAKGLKIGFSLGEGGALLKVIEEANEVYFAKEYEKRNQKQKCKPKSSKR